MALIVAWKFTVVFLALIPVMIFCSSFLTNSIKKYTRKEFQSYEDAGKIASEALSSIRTVLALGIERKLISKYSNGLLTAEDMSRKKGLITGLFNGLSSFLFNSLFAIGIYYGIYLTQMDCINYGPARIVTAFFSIVNTSFSFGQALPFMKDLAEAQGAAVKVFKIVDTKSLIDMFDDYEKMIKRKLIDMKGQIEFKDIRFSYPSRKKTPVLKGLNLKIDAGKTVAIVGSR
jgi:ABC-type multidrug transport system fused ATPase/permease subunit